MTERRRASPAGAETRGRVLLRAARQERGWSQSQAAQELARLSAPGAGGAAGPAARTTSLKTQLSRWENGHAEPDAAHRTLLAALYDRAPDELGLGATAIAGPAVTPADADPAAALRRGLSEADALDEAGLDAWREQLDAAARLDRRLGTAGAGAVVAAVLDRTTDLLDHVVDPDRRRELAAIVAAAAVLAGVQARDRRDLTLAWTRFGAAAYAAGEADRPDLADRARAERARLLVDAGRPELVPIAVAEVRGSWAELARAEAGAARPWNGPPPGGPAPDAPTTDAPTNAPTDRPPPDAPPTDPRPTIDTAVPVVPAEADEIRHHRAVVRAHRGEPGARAELERTADDPHRPARERAEAGAVLALVRRHADEPGADAATARAQVTALRAGSDRMLALLTGADGAAPSGHRR